MIKLAPLLESEATDKTAQTYGRIKELLQTDHVPKPFLFYGRVESFLQDFYMNFKKFVMGAGKLSEELRAMIALAVCAREGSNEWSTFFADRCQQLGMSEQQVAEVIAVASTNAMYNTFFKFRELSGSSLFDGMGVGLRAHTFGKVSLDEQTVELINIAISNLNVCKPCTAGHVEQVRKLGVSDDMILETIQCAATMMAGIMFLKSFDTDD